MNPLTIWAQESGWTDLHFRHHFCRIYGFSPGAFIEEELPLEAVELAFDAKDLETAKVDQQKWNDCKLNQEDGMTVLTFESLMLLERWTLTLDTLHIQASIKANLPAS